MDRSEIISILEDWNYWSKPFRDSYPRIEYEEQIKHKVNSGEIIFLKGVRRSGKSTILINYIKNLVSSGVGIENILFVNLEDPRFVNKLSLELLDKIKEAYIYYINPTKKPYIFLDEVQNIDGFEKWLLREYELDRAFLFATGSNSRLLSKEIGTALSGRYLDINVMPLSFREYLIFKGIEVKTPYDIIKDRLKIERYFEEYMLYGGFPKVALIDDISLKEAELKSYYDSILLRDIVARYNLDNFNALERLSILLLSSISNSVSINKIKNRLGVSFELVSRYMEYLENAFMIYSISLFDWSLQKQFTNPKKIYSIDTGLSKRVSFEVTKRVGDMLENIVFLELRRRYNQIYYYKTSQGYEVDFLIKEYGKITHLIQVSLSIKDEKTKKRELRSLIKAYSDFKYHQDDIELILITMDKSSTEEIDGKIIKIINILEWLILT